MIDFHCHILPAVDDGAKDLTETLHMLRQAQALGIDTIVATPHFKHLAHSDIDPAIFATVSQQAQSLGITLLQGWEFHITMLNQLPLPSLHNYCIGQTPYLLLELDWHVFPPNLLSLLDQIRCQNIIPIIAHPERYTPVQQQPNLLQQWVQMGCQLQINGRSITANPLDRCSNTAKKLFKLYDEAFLSSDAHHAGHYKNLAKALEKGYPHLNNLPF